MKDKSINKITKNSMEERKMSDQRIKTVKQLLTEIAAYSYDNGDWEVIKNTNREEEINTFVSSCLLGCEVVKDGKDGKAVTIKGTKNEIKKVTGEEELFCHDYLMYDLTGHTGEWVVVTFHTLEEVEQYMIGEGGYLNVYCTEMIIFENGVIKPFDMLFQGDDGEDIVLDKDRIDETYDIGAMKERLSVRWKEQTTV